MKHNNIPEAGLSNQERIDKVTRKVAIVIAFIGVFVFFIKLLFF